MKSSWLAACLAGVLVASAHAPAQTQQYDSGGTPLGWRILDSGFRATKHGHFSEAIALASKVLAEAPNFAEGYVVRANFYMEAGRYDEALADIDRATAIHPDTAFLVLMRAEVAVRRRQADLALAELNRANTLPDETVWKRRYKVFGLYTGSELYALQSIALELKRENAGALADFQHMLTFETVYPQYILNFHCYNAAVAGLAEMAALSCDEAIRAESHDRGAYDSRGLAHLKMHEWAKAIADYTQALGEYDDLTLSLYGRGLARLASGDTAGGNADLAAARQGEPDIANIMARLGVKA